MMINDDLMDVTLSASFDKSAMITKLLGRKSIPSCTCCLHWW